MTAPDPASSTHADWRTCLERADHEGALAAWALQHAGRETQADALRDRAEIEERSGDRQVLGDGMQAKGHYLHASQSATDALSAIWRLYNANEQAGRAAGQAETLLCQAIHVRAFGKYQSIDNQGQVDDLTRLEPHPMSSALRAHIEALRVSRDEASNENSTLEDSDPAGTPYASSVGDDPLLHWDLGDRWDAAAAAMGQRYPSSAARALGWCLHFRERYHRAWKAAGGASRWDPDGRDGMDHVSTVRESLRGRPDTGQIPAWADRFLNGDVRRARAALSGPVPPPFALLHALLIESPAPTDSRRKPSR